LRYRALNDLASTMILRPRLSANYARVARDQAYNPKANRMVTCKYAKIRRAGDEPAPHYESEGRGFDSLRAHHHSVRIPSSAKA
jgi:hypothetical protein